MGKEEEKAKRLRDLGPYKVTTETMGLADAGAVFIHCLPADRGYEVDAEVIDLRSLVPLDIEAIEASVKKTGRCVIVHEAPKTSGFGGELSALVQERCFYHLEAPIALVTGWDTPYPHAFEWEYFPGPQRVADALKAVMSGGR